MAKNEIDAVELTRRNRAVHAEKLRNATAEERIRFYREKAQALASAVEARRRRDIATPG